MAQFTEKCISKKNIDVSDDCMNPILKNVGLSVEDIDFCMYELSQPSNTVLEDDVNSFDIHHIYRVPTLLINGVKYKGNWYSHSFFETICEDYFSHDHEACKAKNPSSSSSGIGAVIIVLLCVSVLLIIVLMLYKKFIERSLDETIAEKIKKQTQGSLGQYHMFQDRENSIMRKGIDVVKL